MMHFFIDIYLHRIIIIVIIIITVITVSFAHCMSLQLINRYHCFFCTLYVLTINQSLFNTIITLYNYYN